MSSVPQGYQPGRTRAAAGQQPHAARLSVHIASDPPIRVGAAFRVTVMLECAQGCPCDAVRVREPEGTTRDVPVIDGEVGLEAPAAPGAATWALSGAVAGAAAAHVCETSVTVEVVPHAASLAVWALPTSAAAGERFAIKVGATSTANAAGRSPALAGQAIEIRDAVGDEVARTSLGERPWEGTVGLAWGEVVLAAPAQAGIASWSARLVPQTPALGLALPHTASDFTFTVPVTVAPAHRVEVTVADAASGAPLADALVRLGPFRAGTDAMGRAVLRVAPGTYEVVVWCTGYDIPTPTLEVAGDTAIAVAATALAAEDPDGYWRA